ncbi:hypothetical protein [Bacillus cereus]|uniref:hypothetical protein n=1 Tax=Bacillus cereus TaxID=1396 RepID=UPI000BF788CF|nr:hypothetical protein [Bacillus cereus]PFO87279.1 hypothetical protein COJ89_22805 [Bacillus cereus]PGQ68772.1 hypothetical protein COA21_12195 [Bacillus cereus]PGY71586.1 hypothetical protein COE42_18760 [Bacillus cereus]
MAKLGDVLLQPETGWSRFDDTDKNIFYTGDWSVSTNYPGIFYNGSVHMKPYSKPGVFEVKFTFTGTGLRLIAQKTSVAEFKGLKTNVTIDGIDAGTFEMYDSSIISVYQSIIFEKLNLAPGIHTVTISTSALYLDAVDILGGSLYISKVDTVLKDPEPGWVRIDNTNKYITYIGETWTPRESLGYYNDTYTNRSASAIGDGTVSLNFKGTGIRIIGPKYQSARPDINVQIDGVSYGSYRIWDEKVNGSKQQLVLHEVLGLEDKVHEIKLTGTTHMVVDAFDILGGTIVPKAKQGDLLPNPEPSWKRHKFNAKLSDGTVAIKYYPEGAWEPYKDTDKYTTTRDVGYLKFKFYGSAIRVISTHFNNSATNAKITIDGISSYYNFRGDSDGDRISVEKLGLPLRIHTVEIYANKSGNLNLSAIDLKDGEYFVSEINVGEQLLEPQLGWKRIDDTDNNIEYTGVWATSTADATYYNNTFHYKHATSNTPADSNPVSIKFNFSGTKLRIIGLALSLYDANAKILIDGVEETINFFRPKDFPPIHKALIYEKTGLPNQSHTVEIKGKFMNLDAIDIDESGSIGGKPPVKVGDQLLQPEDGWKRIEDSNSSFKYTGDGWATHSDAKWSGGSTHYCPNSDKLATVEFVFNGTKLRIIGVLSSGYREGQIWIDEQPVETINFEQPNIQYQTLVYEKLGLANGEHKVKLSGLNINFDAIDIDSDGSIEKPLAKVGDQLIQPEPGWKRIDNIDTNIQYLGSNWTSDSDSTRQYYNNTCHNNLNTDKSAQIKFNFKGTKLRLMCSVYENHSNKVAISIDGQVQYYSESRVVDRAYGSVLCYEKLGLTDAVHEVTIKCENPGALSLDAIDIDDNGSISKPPIKVGDQLLQPEAGWKRIDDTDSSFKYVGDWWKSGDTTPEWFNNTFHYVDGASGEVQFQFSGTRLRIIGCIHESQYRSNDIKIIIDGQEEFYSEQATKVGYQTLVYEKLGLAEDVHDVVIKSGTNSPFPLTFDAIDIDSDGSIQKPPAKVGDQLPQPEPGWKRIDDADSNIRYDGKWNFITTQKGAYNETFHYYSAPSGSTEEASATFKFKGTKLRLVALSSYFQKKAILKIDGVSYDLTKVEGRPPINGIQQTLMFEATGLEDKEHLVELSGIDITLDAIDIDKMGSLVKPKPPAKVGDILLQPEPGWNRVDDTNPLIHYRGDYWCRAIGKSASGATYNVTSTYRVPDYADKTVATVEFSFKGTGIRVISKMYDNDSWSDVSIEIDGLTQSYKANGPKREYQMLMYERNLPDGIHKVKISGTQCSFDAFDIKGGELIGTPTNLRDVLFEPEPGWKRINDTDSNIQYTGVWAAGPDVRCYDDTIHYKNSISNTPPDANPVSVKFNFEGTKLRIIGLAGPAYDSNAKILIDGVEESINFSRTSAVYPIYQSLIYEKLGLSNKVHTVEIKGKFINLDAIDIDESGSIGGKPSVKIGDQLLQPEDGWKRIDDNDPLIRYIGNWKLTTGNDKHYNKTTHYNLDKKLDTSFEFEFVGTKLRLLAYGDSGYDATSKVLIDGKEETMVYNSPSGNQVIRYEKIGLDRGKHTVKVIGKAMSLDSIDIDADGYLLARLGDKLVEPEPGWVRFDDTHKSIEYNGFWKTTEGDVSCYNNTHHWKSKEDNNDSTISARFLFKGTKFRLISMTSPSYPEDIELKIDGQKEILKLSGEDMQYQTLAYEKKNLEDMIHVIELSGKYISIDAIDLEEGATLLKLPDEKLKPYQIRSGLIFKEDFDTFDSRWIASPVGSYSLIDRKGYFRMLHNVSRDTLLLADLPNEKEFAFEVSADYTPTHEDDKGGIIVWKNGEENIEFLETEDGTRETTELKWMACKDNEDWTFFSDYGEGFNFCDSDRMNCSKFGVVLKKGSNSKFVNLDIDSIIATRGRKLTIANIAPNISVQMEDEFGRIIFNGNTGYNTGIQITLPSLEFTGKVILTNVEGKELGVIKTTFYGGDVYGFGSNLEIKFSGEELSTLAQTRLPDMISGKSEIMLELVNPSVARANNVNLSIAQYEDKFGWSWADLALDSNGKPGQYQDSINIPYVNPEKTIKFWLKVTKGTDYVGLAPLQFQIHLEHE